MRIVLVFGSCISDFSKDTQINGHIVALVLRSNTFVYLVHLIDINSFYVTNQIAASSHTG